VLPKCLFWHLTYGWKCYCMSWTCNARGGMKMLILRMYTCPAIGLQVSLIHHWVSLDTELCLLPFIVTCPPRRFFIAVLFTIYIYPVLATWPAVRRPSIQKYWMVIVIVSALWSRRDETESIQWGPSWETNINVASQEICHFCGTWLFITIVIWRLKAGIAEPE
jgi:hypothetical protein